MSVRDVVADDGVRLRVDLHGEGRPLLLVAGLGGRASFWDEALPWLAPGRRLILPDHRGAGGSGRPPGLYRIGRLVRDCLHILDAVAPGRVDIVGHSTGGVIAQGIAHEAPERVRRLVLSGSWARPDAQFRLAFATRLAVLRKAGPQTYCALTAAMGFPSDWFDDPARSAPDLFAQLAADLEPLAVAEARLQMLLDDPGLSDAALAAIAAPTLVIGAADDAIVPVRHQRRLPRHSGPPASSRSTAGISTRAADRRFLARSCGGSSTHRTFRKTFMRTENKVVLVTGAAAGIGLATARLFAREGAHIVLADRDEAGVAAAAAAIGPDAASVAGDVSRAADAQRMIQTAVDRFGRLDVLVNNAGFGRLGTVETTEEDDWDSVIDVNLKGVFLCSKYAIPALRRAGGGAIVNLASTIRVVGIPNRAAYVAAKGGVAALTRAMAIDHAAEGIRVNSIAPGVINSSYYDRMMQEVPDPEAFVRGLNARSPLNRMGTPEEIRGRHRLAVLRRGVVRHRQHADRRWRLHRVVTRPPRRWHAACVQALPHEDAHDR